MRQTATAFAVLIGLMAIMPQAQARHHQQPKHHRVHQDEPKAHAADMAPAWTSGAPVMLGTPLDPVSSAMQSFTDGLNEALHAASVLGRPPAERATVRVRVAAKARTAHGRPRIAQGGLGHTGGMNGTFVARLASMNAAMPAGSHCSVGSGWRSYGQQARLRREKGSMAARPGHSNHERGLAADLTCSGHGLAWAHRLAGKFALRFPMTWENWHIEPVGASRYARRHTSTRYAYVRRHHHRHHRYAMQ